MLKKIFTKVADFIQLRWVRQFLGFILFIVFSVLLYFQLKSGIEKFSSDELYNFYRQRLRLSNILILFLTILHMPLNWLLEIYKWKIQIQPLEKNNFVHAAKAVLSGLSVSLVTPNRIGEFGGKLFFVKPENRAAAFYATLVGSLSQWIIIVGFGLIGLLYLYSGNYGPKYFQDGAVYFICLVGILLSFAMLLFFSGTKVLSWIKKTKLFKTSVKYSYDSYINYSKSELFLMLLISTLRYLIYSLQFYLLIFSFGIEVNFLNGISAISVIFLLQTAVPMPASLGLPARASIAIFVFGWFMSDNMNLILPFQTTILLATFLLWILNVLVPAFLGIIFLSRVVSK